MGKIARYLNQLIVGNVFDSPEILEAYSTDRSILKIKPKAVALPESTEDVRKLVRFSYQLASKDISFPITVRGSGLDEMGADISNGLVISTEKMNRLLEADKRERLVRVQSGITLKELNTALSVNGLIVPIGRRDTETIGGLISNCPSDPYAGKYGGIMNYIERIEVVLPNGDILQTGRYSKRSVDRKLNDKSTESKMYRKVSLLIDENDKLIREIDKKRSSYGYSNITKVKNRGSIDLLPLYFGAQGTLGIITEVILRAVPINEKNRRLIATFESFESAKKFLDLANSLNPLELNVYDMSILKLVEENGKSLKELTRKSDGGYVVFAKFDQRIKSRMKKIESFNDTLPRKTQLIIESEKNTSLLDEFENSIIGFLNQTNSGERVPVVTDFYLPHENLPSFLEDLVVLEKNIGTELVFYGSYSASNYNLRPKFSISDDDYKKKILIFLRAGALIIQREGGALTGGTPEGRVKAVISNTEIPEAEKNFYTELKKIFDKHNIMNPSIKLGADPKFTFRHLRTTDSAKIVV